MDNEMIAKMNGLVAKMKEAAEAYYNGQEIMSDFEYDALFDELKKLEKEAGFVLPGSPTTNVVGAKPVDAMNIEGLGEKQIMDLIDEGILKTYSDLFTNLVPNKDKITELDGWGEKSFNVIISGVEKAKKNNIG